jgi:hypothetical protein
MRLASLVVFCGAAVLSASELPPRERALWSAVRAGDTASVRRLLREGARADAAFPSGWTPLMEAARTGRLDVAKALLAGGARVDARDRAAGTALDVAERDGQTAIAALLQGQGAQGSGKSVGSRVCVRPFKGAGFCGTVAAVEGSTYVLAVTGVVGCEGGCSADAECSDGRAVGGPDADAVRTGASVRTKSWCLTHTGLP